MDIRGVEITNQLRSAIRAKLIELGVRYDEELPDYILVMVVNKKSRQQMNEDLNLFLEDNTETFVNWLHDQVLKKLQKVTVAKKKKIIPSAVVKQEDEKKIKSEAQSSGSKSSPEQTEIVTKQERDKEFEELVGDLELLNEDDSKTSLKDFELSEEKPKKKTDLQESIDEESIDDLFDKNLNPLKFSSNEEKSVPLKSSNNKADNFSSGHSDHQKKSTNTEEKLVSSKLLKNKNDEHFSDRHQKRPASKTLEEISNKKNENTKRAKISYDSDSDDNGRLKSSIVKPKLTSVVSVKSRLGVSSPKKIESSSKLSSDARTIIKKSIEECKKKELISERGNTIKIKNAEKRKLHSDDLKIDKSRKDKSQPKKLKSEKSNKVVDLRNELRLNKKSGTVKSRLGITNILLEDDTSPKSSSNIKTSKPKLSNVKSRLGIKVPSRESSVELPDYIDVDDDAESILNTSLKSRIIAVKNSKPENSKSTKNSSIKKKNISKKIPNKDTSDNSEDDDELGKFPSKVIVTPRPLKPLQPFQRRATQSLLLKAVAEANKSVVMQKKIDPCLKEQKAKKKIKIVRDAKKGKILSINLNSKNKINNEKIKIELDNTKRPKRIAERPSKAVRSEHLNLVKSLFKKSDDKQKFLVTLNGLNNNIFEENSDDEEEDVEESELNEEDNDIKLVEEPFDEVYDEEEEEEPEPEEDEEEQVIDDYGNEVNDEDIDIVKIFDYNKRKLEKSKKSLDENQSNNRESPLKKRKNIKPIVYTKSRSKSPENKPTVASAVTTVPRIEKRPPMSSVITTVSDKSSELCRYWPSCTLGLKCAYHHPEVPCSAFPACKFGEKCAYKHPNCKFGSACTKVGCIFSHPPMQCKYHPYCMKPGCQFSHPKTSPSALLNAPLTPDLSSVRAKFTWKKKD